MRRRFLVPLVPLVPLLLFCGCATPPEPAAERTPVASELRRAALWQLAAIRQARTGTGLSETGGVWTTPTGLDAPVSVGWVGPYHELVATVARQTGYGYEPVGNAPVNPIVVRVNAEQIPSVVVLRDASWQARDRASLEIDEARRTLRVRFHHAD